MLQIFILAAVAIFLFWRLRAVLGSRDGFEKTLRDIKETSDVASNNPEVLDEANYNNPDNDIFDYVEENSKSANVFRKMKEFDSEFSVNKFVSGAKIAYEIIVMAFEKGDTEKLGTLLEKKALTSFKSVIDKRKKDGFVFDAKFIGMRDIRIINASFNQKTKVAEVTLSFIKISSESILCLDKSSTSTGRKVPSPMWRVISGKLTPSISNLFNTILLKCNPAVGAATAPLCFA